jgi:hypothetical protein
MPGSTPGSAVGTWKPNSGSVRIGWCFSAPDSAASSSARVALIGMRRPAELAAGPAGVDQPAVDVVLGDQLAQHVAVGARMPRHERRAEASREGRLRLAADALLGAGHLGRVARQEVVHRLAGGELGDRRQHAEGIGRQHDDVSWDGRRCRSCWRWR